jgi:hypothetical protein
LHYGAGKGITQAGKVGRRNYQIRETRLVKNNNYYFEKSSQKIW